MQRRWANFALAVALGLFLVTLGFRHNAVAGYVESMALAGLAGGIADWYAVTALFRHPLGIRWLPHTSIISANRERIIDALSGLVEQELLSVRFIESNIAKLNVSSWIIRLLRADASGSGFRFLTAAAQELLAMLPVDALAQGIEEYVLVQAEGLSAADGLVGAIKWLIQTGNDKALFQFLSRHAVEALNSVEFTDDMEVRLKAMIEEYTKTTTQKFVLGLLESLGTVDYKALSVSVKTHLIDWLESDKALEQFELTLVRVMIALRDDAALRARVERAKSQALTRVPWAALVRGAVDRLRAAVAGGGVQKTLDQMRFGLASALENSPDHQATVERLVKAGAVEAVRHFHPVIGRLVKDNLMQMNERDWIDKLEWYVGRDLQWIRVNGAIVGGLVGLSLAVLVRLLFGR